MPLNCRRCTMKVNTKEAAVSSQTLWCMSVFISCSPCLRASLRHCYITYWAFVMDVPVAVEINQQVAWGRGAEPKSVRKSSLKHRVSEPFTRSMFLNSGQDGDEVDGYESVLSCQIKCITLRGNYLAWSMSLGTVHFFVCVEQELINGL
jgi:hypothetical protein